MDFFEIMLQETLSGGGGGDEPTGTVDIVQNGVTNVKSYASANVQVPNSYEVEDEGKVVSSGTLVSQTSKNINANGTVDTTENNSVVVAVPNTYTASDEGKVVDEGELVAQGSLTITENDTYDTTLISELIANISGGGGGSVNILSGTDVPTSSVGEDGAIYLQCYTQEQITDVSGFTKLYDSSIPYGNSGLKVATRLDETDESELNTVMNKGWNTSEAAYYDSEDRIGALGGYDFGEPIYIAMVKLWLGRYSGQNNTLIATLQTKDSEGTWNDITDFRISGGLPYPLNVFEAMISDTIYGVRWIHKKTPNKTSGNNIVFFGMTIYEAAEGDDIQKTYLKVNGAWQNLIGSDIDDVDTGN